MSSFHAEQPVPWPSERPLRAVASTRIEDGERLMALRPGPLLRAFDEVARAWRLTQRQRAALLAVASRSTLASWMSDPDGAPLDIVRRERIGHVIAIRLALLSLFGRGDAADGWPTAPNADPLFGGRPPIDILASGTTAALAEVRDRLEAEVHR